MNTISVSANELELESRKILEILHKRGEKTQYKKAVVVGLSGDLGSGKTTFSQYIAALLGIQERVASPTFVIEKIYKTKDAGKFETFVHVDAYRLESGKEIDILGFKDVVDAPHTLVLVEWPEKIKETLPPDTMRIQFAFIDEKTRKISY